MVAVGADFPDALSASSYAAVNGYPILLTRTDRLPSATEEALNELGIENTFVIGGEAAVGSAVYNQLPNPERISGDDRYQTSIALAEEFLPTGTSHVYMATGLDFPDAIAGGVLAAKNNSGVLLVRGTRSEPNTVVKQFLSDRNVRAVTLFGGGVAITSEMEQWFKGELGN